MSLLIPSRPAAHALLHHRRRRVYFGGHLCRCLLNEDPLRHGNRQLRFLLPFIMVVCDTSPLLILAKVGRLWLLTTLYDTVEIPTAVLDEVNVRQRADAGAF